MPEPSAADTASLHVDASPDAVYAVVADITRMGELSPECTGGRWVGKLKRPAAGARFLGFNKRGWVRWATLNTVVEADPGKEFSFDTGASGTRWSYRFEPAAGGGTTVTETRSAFKARPTSAKLVTKLLLGGLDEHEDELRDGMVDTLRRLKAVAEAAPA